MRTHLLLASCLAVCFAAAAGPARAADPASSAVAAEWWLGPPAPFSAGADVTPVWQRTQGAGVVVADIDSGADVTHPDLQGALLPPVGLVRGTLPSRDVVGHGTAVAGVIAATGANGAPAGAAPQARVLSYQVAARDGSVSTSVLARGVRTAAANRAVRVINLSLAYPMRLPPLTAAVETALHAGKLVVAAAGNSGSNAAQWPCAIYGVLCVAASDQAGSLPDWSSFGHQTILAAPGTGILTTFPTTTDKTSPYRSEDGTSFSAALVSGIAALLFAAHPEATAHQVLVALVTTTRPTPALAWGVTRTGGEVDAAAALRALDQLLARQSRPG